MKLRVTLISFEVEDTSVCSFVSCSKNGNGCNAKVSWNRDRDYLPGVFHWNFYDIRRVIPQSSFSVRLWQRNLGGSQS